MNLCSISYSLQILQRSGLTRVFVRTRGIQKERRLIQFVSQSAFCQKGSVKECVIGSNVRCVLLEKRQRMGGEEFASDICTIFAFIK